MAAQLRLLFPVRVPLQIPKKPVRDRLATVEGAAAARLSKKLVQLQTRMDLPPLR